MKLRQRYRGSVVKQMRNNYRILPHCQNMSVGHSQNDRPIVIEDRKVCLRNVCKFREFKLHRIISLGKDRISNTNLSKHLVRI